MNELAPGARFALVADEWFDGERHVREPATMKIVEGRLVGVMAGDHAQTLAAQGWPIERGAFLMPGLVDAHVHLFLDGAPTDQKLRSEHLKQPVEALTEAARRRRALRARRRGVVRRRTAPARAGDDEDRRGAAGWRDGR